MLKGVNHIGIAVRSIDEALQAYVEGLGGKADKETHRTADMAARMVEIGETKFEFLEPIGTGGVIAKFLESRGEGIHHLCVEVDDIKQAIQNLSDKGFRMIDKEPRQGIEGLVAFVHPKSMNGVLIELVETPKN
jgi:methylmalonyl-CoA epimerase